MKHIVFLTFILIPYYLVVFPAVTSAVENDDLETASEASGGVNVGSQAHPQENNGETATLNERVLKKSELQIKTQKRLEAIRDNTLERRSQNRLRVEEKVQIRLEGMLRMTIDQFERALLRLTDMSERIEERLTQMEERGFDVSVAFGALEQAQIEIEASTEAVSIASASAIDALYSETPKAQLLVVRTSLNDARTSLKSARDALIRAIASARQNNLEEEPVNAPSGSPSI